MPATAVILAAGLGTRMKSVLPKALHKLAGRPMLRHLLASCEQVFDRIVVVVGPDMEAVQAVAAPHPCVVQAEPLGTAHAALQAAGQFGTGEVAVLYADNPLIRPDTFRGLLARRAAGDAALALLVMRLASASSNGPMPPTPNGPRSCAMPACCAPPPPTWRAGCGRCALTTRRANTT